MITGLLIAALIIAVAWGVVWQVRADRLADENWNLRFAATRAAADHKHDSADHTRLIRRYADLLDEHALCPLPITLAEPAVPQLHLVATDGDQSDWPTVARQVEDETS